MLLYNSQSDQKNYYLSKPILKQDFTQACASDCHLTHSWRSFVRFDFAVFVYVLLLPPVPVDADSTDTAALTSSHDRNHLLAFLNTLLKFQRCQMPTPHLIYFHLSKSGAYTPMTPRWQAAPLTPTPHPDTSKGAQAHLHSGYKSQVQDQGFAPWLWLNHRSLKLLDVEYEYTSLKMPTRPNSAIIISETSKPGTPTFVLFF